MNLRMSRFWEFSPSEAIAFVLPDLSSVTYAQLSTDVSEFQERLKAPKGLIGIVCDGEYLQYVAYLAALGAGCPVALMQEGQSPESTGLSLRYFYCPGEDDLSSYSRDRWPKWHADLALLLSTSGSTGTSKWVRLSFDNLSANAASIAEYLELTPEDRAPMALPFQYSYGMSVLNSHLGVGATLVLTRGSVLDTSFWQVFESTGCTSFAGVPHSFALMEQSHIRTHHLKNLRYVTQAGGRLAPSSVSAWLDRGRSEGWDFFVMYGQTEAAPRISYLPPDLARAMPNAIGICIPGGEMWVADDMGAPSADGEDGELTYRGPNVMMGYAQSDADLSAGPSTDVLKTGDIAKRHPNGVFEIVGRKSRFVKLFGYRISLVEVETHLDEAGIKAACGGHDDVMYILLPEGSAEIRAPEDVARDISDWLNVPVHAFRVEAIEAIPRHPNGKVDHPAVSNLIAEFVNRTDAEDEEPLPFLQKLMHRVLRKRASVREVFQTHFEDEPVGPESSFNGLGGDSLSYVSMALDLEQILGGLPQDWGEMTVAELESLSGPQSGLTQIDTPTALRALAIMLIAMGHLDVWNYGSGGALSLFMVAGWSFSAFTLPTVLSSERAAPIVVLALRIALLTLAWTTFNELTTGWGQWPAFLFISNWISPSIQGGSWFIEVYLQILALVTLAFALPSVRRSFHRSHFAMTAGVAGMCALLAAGSDVLFDTEHLYRRLPHLMAWIFFCGCSAHAASTHRQRGIATAIFLLGYLQLQHDTFAFGFFPLSGLVLIWLPVLPMPYLLLRPFREIAGASLVIYLTHFKFDGIARHFNLGEPIVGWISAIVGGVILWRLYEPIDVIVRRTLKRSI